MTMTATPTAQGIDINTIYSTGKQTNSRTFRISRPAEGRYIFPDDLHPATIQMLDGIARAFDQFLEHGFDREP